MLTGELKPKNDSSGNGLSSGEIPNPQEVIVQLTCPLFVKGLDKRHAPADSEARSGNRGRVTENRECPRRICLAVDGLEELGLDDPVVVAVVADQRDPSSARAFLGGHGHRTSGRAVASVHSVGSHTGSGARLTVGCCLHHRSAPNRHEASSQRTVGLSSLLRRSTVAPGPNASGP